MGAGDEGGVLVLEFGAGVGGGAGDGIEGLVLEIVS